MSASERDYPAAHSMDTEWFAVDGEGRVAVFHTHSDGPLPKALPNEWGERVVERFVERLGRSPGGLAYDLSDSGADNAVYYCQFDYDAPDNRSDISRGEKLLSADEIRKEHPFDDVALLLLASEEALALLGADSGWLRVPTRDQILVFGSVDDVGLIADLWQAGHLRKAWLQGGLDPVRFGLFTYEYKGWMLPKAKYTRIGAPLRPIHLADIPAEVLDAVTVTSLPGADFSKESPIQVLDHVECRAAHYPSLTKDDAAR